MGRSAEGGACIVRLVRIPVALQTDFDFSAWVGERAAGVFKNVFNIQILGPFPHPTSDLVQICDMLCMRCHTKLGWKFIRHDHADDNYFLLHNAVQRYLVHDAAQNEAVNGVAEADENDMDIAHD